MQPTSENITTLQTSACIHRAELAQFGHRLVVDRVSARLAQALVWEIINRCVVTEETDAPVVRVDLEVCVMTPAELGKEIEEAYSRGRLDQRRSIR